MKNACKRASVSVSDPGGANNEDPNVIAEADALLQDPALWRSNFDQCLQLLQGPSNEQRFVGLLLASKLLPGRGDDAVREVLNALGLNFVQRLLLPLTRASALAQQLSNRHSSCSGNEPHPSPPAPQPPQQLQTQQQSCALGLAVLSTLCRLPDVAMSAEVHALVPAVVHVLRKGGLSGALQPHGSSGLHGMRSVSSSSGMRASASGNCLQTGIAALSSEDSAAVADATEVLLAVAAAPLLAPATADAPATATAGTGAAVGSNNRSHPGNGNPSAIAGGLHSQSPAATPFSHVSHSHKDGGISGIGLNPTSGSNFTLHHAGGSGYFEALTALSGQQAALAAGALPAVAGLLSATASECKIGMKGLLSAEAQRGCFKTAVQMMHVLTALLGGSSAEREQALIDNDPCIPQLLAALCTLVSCIPAAQPTSATASTRSASPGSANAAASSGAGSAETQDIPAATSGATAASSGFDEAALQLEALHALQLVLPLPEALPSRGAIESSFRQELGHSALARSADAVRYGLDRLLRSRISPVQKHSALQLAAALVGLAGPAWLLPRAGESGGLEPGSLLTVLVETLSVESNLLLYDALHPDNPVLQPSSARTAARPQATALQPSDKLLSELAARAEAAPLQAMAEEAQSMQHAAAAAAAAAGSGNAGGVAGGGDAPNSSCKLPKIGSLRLDELDVDDGGLPSPEPVEVLSSSFSGPDGGDNDHNAMPIPAAAAAAALTPAATTGQRALQMLPACLALLEASVDALASDLERGDTAAEAMDADSPDLDDEFDEDDPTECGGGGHRQETPAQRAKRNESKPVLSDEDARRLMPALGRSVESMLQFVEAVAEQRRAAAPPPPLQPPSPMRFVRASSSQQELLATATTAAFAPVTVPVATILSATPATPAAAAAHTKSSTSMSPEALNALCLGAVRVIGRFLAEVPEEAYSSTFQAALPTLLSFGSPTTPPPINVLHPPVFHPPPRSSSNGHLATAGSLTSLNSLGSNWTPSAFAPPVAPPPQQPALAVRFLLPGLLQATERNSDEAIALRAALRGSPSVLQVLAMFVCDAAVAATSALQALQAPNLTTPPAAVLAAEQVLADGCVLLLAAAPLPPPAPAAVHAASTRPSSAYNSPDSSAGKLPRFSDLGVNGIAQAQSSSCSPSHNQQATAGVVGEDAKATLLHGPLTQLLVWAQLRRHLWLLPPCPNSTAGGGNVALPADVAAFICRMAAQWLLPRPLMCAAALVCHALQVLLPLQHMHHLTHHHHHQHHPHLPPLHHGAVSGGTSTPLHTARSGGLSRNTSSADMFAMSYLAANGSSSGAGGLSGAGSSRFVQAAAELVLWADQAGCCLWVAQALLNEGMEDGDVFVQMLESGVGRLSVDYGTSSLPGSLSSTRPRHPPLPPGRVIDEFSGDAHRAWLRALVVQAAQPLAEAAPLRAAASGAAWAQRLAAAGRAALREAQGAGTPAVGGVAGGSNASAVVLGGDAMRELETVEVGARGEGEEGELLDLAQGLLLECGLADWLAALLPIAL